MNLDHFDAFAMTILLIMRRSIINDQGPIAKIHVSQLSQIQQFLVSQKFILQRYRVQNFGSTVGQRTGSPRILDRVCS